MPIVGFIDPQTGQEYPTAEYLELARSGSLFLRGNPFHYAALKTMATERDVKGVSATELLGCPRSWFLKREYPYYVQPQNHWRLYRGTSIHTAIEQQTEGAGDHGDFVAEVRFYRTVEVDGSETPISGQVDMYWPKLGVIADHKDKVYAAKKGGAQERHVWQMSIYAWIIAGDTSNNYPVPTKGGIYYQDGKNPVLKTFDLYPLDTVEPFVIERLREYRGMGNGTYPEPLRDEDDIKTMCAYCPVRDICEKLAQEGK